MTSQIHTQKFLRQRKFFLVIPLLILPFVVLIFWALGGGKPGGTLKGGLAEIGGINFHLPDAHFGIKKAMDKLALYEEASKDSAKLREAMKNDPYYTREETKDSTASKTALETIFEKSASKYGEHFSNENMLNSSGLNSRNGIEAKEKDITEKLAILKKQISQKSDNPATGSDTRYSANPPTTLESANQNVNKMEKIMGLSKNNKEADPDITKLDGMLNKIIAIQHPESMQDSLQKLSERNSKAVFPVLFQASNHSITVFDTLKEAPQENGFYSLPSPASKTDSRQNAIEAEVQETQTLVSGSTVKLRLINEIFVNGIKIQKDAFIYGTASLSNERLKININSLRSENNLLPVALEAYDLDGMAGIYIPGSISRDVSKQSADQAISTIGLTTLDPSVQAQAASAGIQAAKTLISKKVKLVRVTVKEGYRLLLKDDSQK